MTASLILIAIVLILFLTKHYIPKERFMNDDKKMVILPDEQWEIPRPQKPVCVSKKQCKVQPMISSTPLIGSLL